MNQKPKFMKPLNRSCNHNFQVIMIRTDAKIQLFSIPQEKSKKNLKIRIFATWKRVLVNS